MGVGGQRHAPAASSSRTPRTHCIGGWVGPTAGLDECGKSRPHLDSIPDRPARTVSHHFPFIKANYRAKQRFKSNFHFFMRTTLYLTDQLFFAAHE